MNSQRQSQYSHARVVSPPPTYDQSANDTVLSLDDTGAVTVTKSLGPQSLVSSARPRPGSLSSLTLNSVASSVSQQSASSLTPQVLSADLSQTISEVSSNLLRPLPARQDVVLTYHSEQQAQQPQGPRRYNFSSVGPYSMVLHPSLTTSEMRPLYHISWRHDYFSPLSVVTTIRKGATEDGTFVAEFGLGAMCFRGEEQTWIKDRLVLTLSHANQYTWSRNGVQHTWTSELKANGLHRYLCTQHTSDGQEVLAIMRPPDYKVLGIFRPSQLKVYPAGYNHLDEILLCALILSRQPLEGESIAASKSASTSSKIITAVAGIGMGLYF